MIFASWRIESSPSSRPETVMIVTPVVARAGTRPTALVMRATNQSLPPAAETVNVRGGASTTVTLVPAATVVSGPARFHPREGHRDALD